MKLTRMFPVFYDKDDQPAVVDPAKTDQLNDNVDSETAVEAAGYTGVTEFLEDDNMKHPDELDTKPELPKKETDLKDAKPKDNDPDNQDRDPDTSDKSKISDPAKPEELATGDLVTLKDDSLIQLPGEEKPIPMSELTGRMELKANLDTYKQETQPTVDAFKALNEKFQSDPLSYVGNIHENILKGGLTDDNQVVEGDPNLALQMVQNMATRMGLTVVNEKGEELEAATDAYSGMSPTQRERFIEMENNDTASKENAAVDTFLKEIDTAVQHFGSIATKDIQSEVIAKMNENNGALAKANLNDVFEMVFAKHGISIKADTSENLNGKDGGRVAPTVKKEKTKTTVEEDDVNKPYAFKSGDFDL